ncbi:glycosyltransferase family 2 protein [Candidatus Parcubacteria bacterium]|nr:MAG: glycosyltransferase family 2 protein [Candidatus Parcubacteria bacterium]
MPLPEAYFYTRLGRAAELESRKDKILYRFFEILPGVLAWSTLALLIFLSYKIPVFVALFIIIFDFYWFVRTLYLFFFLKATYDKMKKRLHTDWLKKLEKFPPKKYSLPLSSWRDLWHVVFLPMYKEDKKIVEQTIEAIKAADYPKERMVVVLAIEERAGEEAKNIAVKMKEKFKEAFGDFIVTVHPNNISGEVAGKGSNLHFAAGQIKTMINEKGIPYERIIVSAFDVDTQVPRGYFGCLTYHYLKTKNPARASYQPIPFYHNNIWEAPALARVLSYSSTFWHMMQQERPHKQTTFSSHSMSFKALEDVGFWQNNMVSEDSRIFFQSLLRYDGDYKVVSLYYPVSMDANVAESFGRTMINIYKQQRRWAWGVENLPYLAFGFLKNKAVALKIKIKYLWLLVEGFHTWATSSLIIFLMGWLPIAIGGQAFRSTVLSYNLPKLTQILLTISMIGIVTSATLSIALMPPPPKGKSLFHNAWLVLQWFLTPFALMIFSSIPALEAQTRLMLGKYMGFWVTEKSRK